jgi:hypothetical protein
MPEIEFKISGLAELDRALRELPPRAAKRIIRKEMVAAVEPWAEDMRGRVRRGPHHKGRGAKEYGLLAANIKVRTRIKSDLSGAADAGPAAKAGNYDLFWAVILEFGRKGGTSPRGRHYPAAPAYPFVRPAFEARKQDVLDRFIAGMRAALNDSGLHTT